MKKNGGVDIEKIRTPIQLLGDRVHQTPKGYEYIDPGYTVYGYTIDEIYKVNNIGYEVIVENTVNVLKTGDYTITYILKDTKTGDIVYETVRYVSVLNGPDVELFVNDEPYDGTWKNQITAKVTMKNNSSTWVQYKINADGEWTDQNANIVLNGRTATINIEHEFIDGEVYFREIGVNGVVTNVATSGYIYKQEKLAPQVKNMRYETVDRTIIIKALLEDEHEVAEYAISAVGEKEPTTWIEIPIKEVISGEETIIVENIAVNIEAESKGSNTIIVWAKDKAGNIGQSMPFKVVKDITPPTGTVKIKDAKEIDGETYVNTEEIVLLLTAQDNSCEEEEIQMVVLTEAEYEAIEDEKTLGWENFQNRKTCQTESGDGPKTIYILLKDKAGNIATKEIEYR